MFNLTDDQLRELQQRAQPGGGDLWAKFAGVMLTLPQMQPAPQTSPPPAPEQSPDSAPGAQQAGAGAAS